MNPLAALSIAYLLITVCSASILYFSFNGKIDASGKYFFLGELTIIPGIFGIALINLEPQFLRPELLFTLNASVWISNVCVLFSTYALSSTTNLRKFTLAILCSAIYASAIEVLRYQNASINTLTLFVSITDVLFCFWTYFICKSTKENDLQNNLFFGWFKYIEVMLGLFAIIRIISCLTNDAPINARIPSTPATIFYILFMILNVFRYISYQSLRISWVDPRTNSINPLNRNLAVVTQEKNSLLQGLIASNRVIGIGAMASSLAHQLSQPLTTIGLQTETLKRDVSKDSQNGDTVIALDKINVQLSKLSNLVLNLRQLFNTNQNEFYSINLSSAIDEIIEIIEPTINSKNIHLKQSIAKELNILGDAIQIQQVLINLLNNAIDAIETSNPPIREIRLAASSVNDLATIYIKDTGGGIDSKALPSIFELYKTTKKDGMGIGLWLSKTIINRHRGDIFAENNSIGGATFTIKLPLSLTHS